MMARIASRLDVLDPGAVRTCRAAAVAGAAVLAWATTLAATTVFGVADPLRITLFATGACFFAALFVTDPRRRDRVRTLGWAWVVSAVAMVVTVGLNPTPGWVSAFLILQIFASFALRSRGPRAANLAVIGALATAVAASGHITTDRVGWFVIAETIGFAWLAAADWLIVPDDPVRSQQRCVRAFCRQAADAVADVVDTLTTTRGADTPERGGTALHKNLDRVRSCRAVIDNEYLAAGVPHRVGRHAVQTLRVALYCAQRGLEDMADRVDDPCWIAQVTDDLAASLTTTLQALVAALRDGADAQSMAAVTDHTQKLLSHLHDALTHPANAGDASRPPPEAVLAAVTTIGAVELVAQSTSQARELATATPQLAGAAQPEGHDTAAPQASVASLSAPRRTLQPSIALGIQAVVAAVVAGLIAKSVGIEQHLVVAWTASVVIAGSAGASTRRAWTRLVATTLGAVGGVAIAASVPHNVVWTVGVVTVGVFLTIFSAPLSYPAMVFWMTTATVSLFATKGFYLDVVRDKAVAALIAGCVAAVVAITVAPIRLSRDVRPALLRYLDALDTALETQLPAHTDRRAQAVSELDRAHRALDAIIESAATEIQVFAQPGNPFTEEGIRIDAVHEAFLRLTPLLSEPSRRLHGWTDQQVHIGIQRLRDAVEVAQAAARGEVTVAVRSAPVDARTSPSRNNASIELAESLRRVENLHARLAELAVVLGGRPGSPAAAH